MGTRRLERHEAVFDRRHVHQLPDGRRRSRAHPRRARQGTPPARRGQGAMGSEQHVPHEPEHHACMIESMKATQPLEEQVQSALAWLKSHATKATLEGMARYAIPSDHAYGVAMKDVKALGKTLGRNHA